MSIHDCAGCPQGYTYRDLKHKFLAVVLRLERVQDGRELGGVEFDCDDISSQSLF